MKKLKVSIIGNSVGLRVRPPGEFPSNKTFGQLLEERLNENNFNATVLNSCVGRSLLEKIYNDADLVINEFPDYYLIVAGVTDASTREIPLWYSNIIYGKRSSFRRKLALWIYLSFFKPRRNLLVRLRGCKSWTTEKYFYSMYKKIVSDLIKNTNAICILFTINRCTERVERELPGTSKNIELFNQRINQVVSSFPCERIKLLDTLDLDPDVYLPDGVHFSQRGHEVIASRSFDLVRVLEYCRI